METPKLFVDELNKIVLDFIWGHKPPKIKYTMLIKTRQEGGLEMKDFALFNKALKFNWVERLCTNPGRSVAVHPEVPPSECWGPRAFQM